MLAFQAMNAGSNPVTSSTGVSPFRPRIVKCVVEFCGRNSHRPISDQTKTLSFQQAQGFLCLSEPPFFLGFCWRFAPNGLDGWRAWFGWWTWRFLFDGFRLLSCLLVFQVHPLGPVVCNLFDICLSVQNPSAFTSVTRGTGGHEI